ncbi:P60-like protein [Panus rudis PR-1116 ss-1]|nr:P60-like protein [Panus rudis PR-1116 ss-1]
MTATKATSTATTVQKKVRSSIGAPSQRNQSSRKGKKAWRKHVDLEDVEEKLEEIRTEERVVGSALHAKSDSELFQIDVKGDDNVRKRLPKFSTSQLTSAKILAQRSAVPAVISRFTSFSNSASAAAKRKLNLSHEEKERLLRIGKKVRKGPFNAVMDPTEVGAGSALLEVTEAVKKSGTYDVWGAKDESEDIEIDGVDREVPIPGKKPKVKAPKTPNPRQQIAVSAVPTPHEGTSYNPPVTSHQTLLQAAIQKEEQRAKEAEENQAMRAKLEEARKKAAEEEMNADGEGAVAGMKVDLPKEGQEETNEDENGEILPAKKMPERKTKQERLKAAKRRAESRAILEKLHQKRLLSSIPSAKSLRKSVLKQASLRAQQRAEQKRKEEEERMKKGLAGRKLGKHVVPEGEIDVQLGEELSESLRGLKPEGNLFRDRFLNLQHRALVEPRVPVLPKKRKFKIKEYETHQFKRFDRDNP